MPDSDASFPSQLHRASRSIAISALVRPSRWAQILYAALSAVCLIVSLTILFGQADNVANISQYVGSFIACAAALRVGIEACKKRSSVFFDMSGTGDLRIGTVPNASVLGRGQLDSTSMPATYLMAGSVITPFLLVLRLAQNHGSINTLVIFPDSVSGDAFRRLSLACRWLAGQKKRQQLAPL